MKKRFYVVITGIFEAEDMESAEYLAERMPEEVQISSVSAYPLIEEKERK